MSTFWKGERELELALLAAQAIGCVGLVVKRER